MAKKDDMLNAFVRKAFLEKKVFHDIGIDFATMEEQVQGYECEHRICLFERMFYKLENEMEKQVKDLKSKIDSGALAFSVSLYFWQKYKTVYHFDLDFWQELAQTQSSKVYVEILRRLPFNSFFIYVPNENVVGYLVHLSFEFNRLNMAFGRVVIKNGKAVFDVSQSRSIKDGTDIDIDKFECTPGWEHEDETLEYASHNYYNDIARGVLMAAYYLASSNAKLKEFKRSKKDKLVRSDGKKVAINEIRVGPVIRKGPRVGTTKAKPDEVANRPSLNKSKASAHVRRAHWHHYWTGPGRQRLEVRWIEPVFVSGNGTEIDTVIRETQRKTGENRGLWF